MCAANNEGKMLWPELSFFVKCYLVVILVLAPLLPCFLYSSSIVWVPFAASHPTAAWISSCQPQENLWNWLKLSFSGAPAFLLLCSFCVLAFLGRTYESTFRRSSFLDHHMLLLMVSHSAAWHIWKPHYPPRPMCLLRKDSAAWCSGQPGQLSEILSRLWKW